MLRALVALGTNVGDRAQILATALERLAALPNTVVSKQSQVFQTKPVGGPADQGEFFNAAALLKTALSPEELLAQLLRIEQEMGRERSVHWGPRTIDLDLLLYEEEERSTPQLQLPHPRFPFRHFMLLPAAEIAPEMYHPQLGMTLAELREHLLQSARLLVLQGHDPILCERLARDMARQQNCSLATSPKALAQLFAATTAEKPAWIVATFLPEQTEETPLAHRSRLTVWVENSTVEHPLSAAGQKLSELQRLAREGELGPFYLLQRSSLWEIESELAACLAAAEA